MRNIKSIRYKNAANYSLNKITKLQITKCKGPDVSILAGPFSKGPLRNFPLG